MDDWRQHAACRHEDPDLFFPIGTSGPALLQTQQAKAVCHRCPVREQCLDRALATDQAVGVWGGTTEAERRALRQRTGARRGS
ncbi:WhiB family transcriptional regulator [Streptomyces sp. DSM 15324]|uniref:WhiB family transcriptional regulator n=1 Tax=Streptomyces sp. DSM 15324 TaxID=1739111 RepID=UPI0007485577|nr:WhiB family transcriptional regulator [Streptomyces sp. DSM 15324]KUO09181.1 transcription factor WhiB [Streptomyces sp. DSM 15324]